MHQCGYFYIMANTHNTVLYCGATTDLYNRVLQHRSGLFRNSFTSRYNIKKLVYFETFTFVADAFEREKKVKGGSRKKKIDLIVRMNPGWEDLFPTLADRGIEELRRLKKHRS